ncbi:MAG TPA: helix-turn-helix domain-containing protein [Aliidongia sp.]|uniref:helix-turn-helix domain-containing protein n=1 Tax=Aliidongia sp. TaxID=1914230 RepID=UPI002DDD14D3|nr:helix-turn-helix domain-containing protein [Aliidongia sp.]HEV2677347.1 helix-turn-helix domain-containing protein [Aliidongia sp.]
MSLAFAFPTDRPAIAVQTAAARTPWTMETGLSTVGPVLHFVQDQGIYGEGDAADALFKVVSGVVRTCKFLRDGRRLIDAFHVAGDVFGVEAGADYSFSSEAVCDCTVVSYRRRSLEASASKDTGLSLDLFSYAMRSLARAQVHALLLGRRSAVEKVAAFLVEWATHSTDTDTVMLEMARQDIADYLGLTIETVSRTLSQFERDRLIAFSSLRHIRLTEPAVLRALNS